MFRLCPCTSAVGLLRSSFCKSSPKNSHKWTSQFLPTSFSDGNSSMRQHTEPLGSPQEAKGCDQILASGCSAWHRPGGTSSLAQSLAQSSNQCSRWHLSPRTFSVIVMAAISLAAVQYWWRSKLTNWRILMRQLITLWWWERESRRPRCNIIPLYLKRHASPSSVWQPRQSRRRSWQRISWHPARRCSLLCYEIKKKKVWVEAKWSEPTVSTPRWFSMLKILAAITCLLSGV